MKSQYRKFTDQIAADAARAVPASAAANSYCWLAGTWTWQEQTLHFEATPYGVALQPDFEPFLIYNQPTGMWVLVLADPDSYGMLIGMEMRRGQSRFTGEVTIDGEPVQLRQTWRRISEHTIEIENERRRGDEWETWDRSVLERVKPAN